jgi:hypothetical protein
MKSVERMALLGMIKQENGRVLTEKPLMLITPYLDGIQEPIKFLLTKVLWSLI